MLTSVAYGQPLVTMSVSGVLLLTWANDEPCLCYSWSDLIIVVVVENTTALSKMTTTG